MNFFTALVVDDDPDITSEASGSFEDDLHIRIITASNLDEARDALSKNFIHSAFVDLQLDTTNPRHSGGLQVLRELFDIRPACRRYLLTQHADKYKEDFFTLVHPLNPIVHGALDKGDFRDHFASVLRRLADNWMRFPVVVVGAQSIVESLVSKGIGLGKPLLAVDEVDYITSTILGQGKHIPEDSNDEFNRISLTILGKGRSRSVVALGKPENKLGKTGIFCVIKFGLRSESEEEFNRYNRYVRLLVSLNRRVELLDYVAGDCLAAVCYSFAGKSPDRISSLGDLLDTEHSDAYKVIENLFEPSTKEWYATEKAESDMAGYFNLHYHLNAASVVNEVVMFAEENATLIGGVKVKNQVKLDGDSLKLPVDCIVQLRRRYKSCVIHGDLNAENVIISDDGRVICIDYRYTGWGPRTLDFASLQASARISETGLNSDYRQMIRSHRIERDVWKTAWAAGSAEIPPKTTWPYWATVSYKLLQQLRATFPDAEPHEHAATCLLLGLRLFRVRSLGQSVKMRFLVWMSSLVSALETKTSASKLSV